MFISLSHSLARVNVSLKAFGFFGARGVAGHVPVMYTHFARQFMRNVHRYGSEQRVKYSEYFREGWTFHGKGEQ